MDKISCNENVITIDGVIVQLKYKIKQFIEFENAVVVRLEIKARDDDNNNVYGIKDGKVAWRVQDMLDYNPDYAPFMPNPYSGIRIYDKDPGVVLATSAEGFRFLINPNNGRIIGTESWVK